MPRKEEEKGSGSESLNVCPVCGWQVRKASSQGNGDRVRSEYAYIQQRYEQGNLNVSRPPFSPPMHVLFRFPVTRYLHGLLLASVLSLASSDLPSCGSLSSPRATGDDAPHDA